MTYWTTSDAAARKLERYAARGLVEQAHERLEDLQALVPDAVALCHELRRLGADHEAVAQIISNMIEAVHQVEAREAGLIDEAGEWADEIDLTPLKVLL